MVGFRESCVCDFPWTADHDGDREERPRERREPREPRRDVGSMQDASDEIETNWETVVERCVNSNKQTSKPQAVVSGGSLSCLCSCWCCHTRSVCERLFLTAYVFRSLA